MRTILARLSLLFPFPPGWIALLAGSYFLLSNSVFSQGSLTPPGAPAPTMKTLQEVEPRTPISTLPFTITQSGSYYLTGNLQFSAASGNAITIQVSNVTLDLMGFTLSSTAAVTGSAIRMNPALLNIAVSNGIIAGNSTVTVSGTFPNQTWTFAAAGFDYGIESFGTPEASECHFSHLRISGCRTKGLETGDRCIIESVTATQNGAGIDANLCNVSNSTAGLNNGQGLTGANVSSCTASSNAGNGITAASVINSTAVFNGAIGILISGSATHCLALSNQGHGISGATGSINDCAANSNGSDGINSSNGVVAFCKAGTNNQKNDGSVDIDAGAGTTRTGNNPAP